MNTITELFNGLPYGAPHTLPTEPIVIFCLAAFPVVIGAILFVLVIAGFVWIGIKIVSLIISILNRDAGKPSPADE